MMLRILLGAGLILGAALGGRWGYEHAFAQGFAQGKAQGQEQVSQQWQADVNRRNALALQDWQLAQQRLYAKEAEWRQENERITHEFNQRESALRSAVSASSVEHQRLLDIIAQLKQRDRSISIISADSADLSAVVRAGDASSTSPSTGIDAATTARELLAECSGRYTQVAQAADALSAQLLGLQDWARMVRVGDGF